MSNKNRNIAKKYGKLAPAVGEVFNLNNKKYKCISSGVECEGCAFEDDEYTPECACHKLACTGDLRPDKKSVIYKEVE